jgi:hypothetical protein
MKPIKPPEITVVGERLGLKVYLCQACAAKLRKLAAEQGGHLVEINTRELCEKCRPPGFDEPPTAKAN